MSSRRAVVIGCFAVMAFLSGCSSYSELRKTLDPSQFVVTIPNPDGPGVKQCLLGNGGSCVAPAAPAAVEIDSAAIVQTLDSLKGQKDVADAAGVLEATHAVLLAPLQRAASGLPQNVQFHASQVRDFANGLSLSLRQGQWQLLQHRAAGLGSPALSKELRYIQAYFEAYFRSGMFIQLDVSMQTVRDKLTARLRKQFPKATDDQLSAMVDAILGAKTDVNFLTVGNVGFITRAGASYKMPAISVTITPEDKKLIQTAKIDSVALVSDLARVLVEAVMDAHFQLPATSNATGVIAPVLQPDNLQANDECKATKGNAFLSSEDFATVDAWASRAEAGTELVVGSVIRGAGWVALNNEHVATLVETLVSVAVRKATENAVWCYMTCTREAQPPKVAAAGAGGANDPCAEPASIGFKAEDARAAGTPTPVHYTLSWD